MWIQQRRGSLAAKEEEFGERSLNEDVWSSTRMTQQLDTKNDRGQYSLYRQQKQQVKSRSDEQDPNKDKERKVVAGFIRDTRGVPYFIDELQDAT